jgi:chromosome segregation ATPase
MTFQQRVQSSYPAYTQILSTLSAHADACREIKEQSRFITELKYRIKNETKNLKTLQSTVEPLRSAYEELRDGPTKRLFSKVPSKTDEQLAKIARAEYEYQGALENLAKADKALETLNQTLADAEHNLPILVNRAAIHTSTLSELDTLYSTLFSIPHESYPAETSADEEIALLQVPISTLQAQIDAETAALKHLSSARKSLVWAHAALQNALDTDLTTKDSDCSRFGWYMVRNAVSTAQLHAMHAEDAWTAARTSQPGIAEMAKLAVLEEGFMQETQAMGGFINSWPHKALLGRIRDAKTEIQKVAESAAAEETVAKERMRGLKAEKAGLEDEVKEILRRAREIVMEMVCAAGDGTAGRAGYAELSSDVEEAHVSYSPPGYSA